MVSKVYNLPEITFVGGETHDLRFRLFTDTGKVFNASGVNATFSVVYSVNRTGTPVLSKQMTVLADDDGVESILAVTLLPTDTVNLYGKYIYQITIQDMSNEVDIPSQGILGITNNIDKSLIKQGIS